VAAFCTAAGIWSIGAIFKEVVEELAGAPLQPDNTDRKGRRARNRVSQRSSMFERNIFMETSGFVLRQV
jgi:hypothetical protein